MPTDDILYHYCSTESFVSIITSNSLRLSSLRLSNDTMEGRLVNEVIMRMANRDAFGATVRERLKSGLDLIEGLFDGLGFCLSEVGDLLSQWRGYADDAKGVAIGFNRAYLHALAELYRQKDDFHIFGLHRIVYRPEEHEAYLQPTYRELCEFFDSGALLVPPRYPSLLNLQPPAEEISEYEKKYKRDQTIFISKITTLVPRLYELKSEAFDEEKEWRLVTIHDETAYELCNFRSSGGRVIPYREIRLRLNELKEQPIAEVILGPKHETPRNVVESMLKASGFGTVPVRRSKASYR